MTDQVYINFVVETKFLSDGTKKTYLTKLKKIQTEIMPKPIDYILHHPEEFDQMVRTFAQNTRGRTGQSLGAHTIDSYFSAVISLFLYNQTLREKNHELFLKWKRLHEAVRQPINDKYKSNEPTERQQQAYLDFDQVVKIRDSLPVGSYEKLLIMLYTEIPPVRSDYYRTHIVTQFPGEAKESESENENENMLIIDEKTSHIVLSKYKTAKKYGVIMIETTPELHLEIIESLIRYPRDYLFVGADGKPYQMENTFNKWANRTLKRIYNRQHFSLTMLRHIYISRRDLKLEEKSGLEQEQIAKIMGHSIEQQRRYLWHSWLKKYEPSP